MLFNTAMQHQLNVLYEGRLIGRQLEPTNDLYDRIKGPDLVWLAAEFTTATPRVLLVGQQPLGCDYTYREFVANWTVERALDSYRLFNFGESYNASPWWTFYNQLRKRLFGEDCARGVVGWSNLVKFVTRDGESVIGMPFEDVVFELQVDLFVSELAIMEPDVCVFATGPDYDRIIERYYPGATFEDCGLGSRTLARVKHQRLPVRSFRTYHPKALRLQKKWDAVFEQLCGDICRE